MKRLVFGILLCLIVVGAYAQSKPWQVGVLAGPSLSFLYGPAYLQEYKATPIVRYAFGIKAQYAIINKIAIEINLFYERKGNTLELYATNTYGMPLGDGKLFYSYDYLSVPIFLAYYFGTKNKFFVKVGPNVNYLISSTITAYELGMLAYNENATKSNARFDLGISVGFGVEIPLSEKINFSIEARNNLGLLNIFTPEFSISGPVRTNSSNILIGVSYTLGK